MVTRRSQKRPSLVFGTDVGKAQEVKGLWLLETPLSPVRRRKARELDEAGLDALMFVKSRE
ncbi:hypothetical protein [Ferrimicrobium sp.]|uniref:hypothetical protein n=1 Tax=Ferrimicrobium sp. TaxID=2926050 RepID=UPI002616E23D|nr:hypothetical protein [Ferrimicrobium sp.]